MKFNPKTGLWLPQREQFCSLFPGLHGYASGGGGLVGFPTVEGFQTSIEDTNTTTHVVDIPGGIITGETILVFFATDGAPSITFPAGWTVFFNAVNGSNCKLNVAWRLAGASEPGTIDVTTGASEKSAHVSYRISGATDPTVTPPDISISTGQTNDNPDPASETPSAGSRKYLWIAGYGNDGDRQGTLAPTNYIKLHTRKTTDLASGCGIGTAQRSLEAATENPGQFTIEADEQWVACVVAVHPA